MTGTKHAMSYCTCWLTEMSWYFDFTTPHFPHDLRDEVDVRCAVTVNVCGLLIFVSWISIMLRLMQADGEFHNVLTFLLIEFKSRCRLSYFVYPNLTSNCVGWYPKLCLIIELSFMLVLLFSGLHKNRNFKIAIWLRIRVCLSLFVKTVRMRRDHGHDKTFSGKTGTVFYELQIKTEKIACLCNIFVYCLPFLFN